jgi:hypothetical protein
LPAFYIVLQEKIPGVDSIGLEGRALCKHIDSLQAIVNQTGVKPLTSFLSFDKSEVEGLLGDTPEKAGIEIPDKQYFPAADGLHTIAALLAAVAAQKTPDQEKLTNELREFKDVLSAAQARNVGWHLGIDY